MTVKSEVQGVVQALFGAYAGGYLAELTAEATANGSAAVAARLVTIQGIILGRDMSDNQTFVDTILNNLGVPSTNAAYEAAAAWAMGELTAGASRADIVSAAVAFLDGIAAGTIVDSKYTAIAQAFAASVEAGIEYSEGEGAEVFGLDDLQAAAAIAAPFNLTAALATLKADKAAVQTFLKALDIDGVAGPDNAASATQAADNDAALDAKLAAKWTAADGKITGDYLSTNTAAANAALLANQEAQNTANLTIAQNNLTAANAAVAAVTGLQAAVTAYDAAVTAEAATTKALEIAANNLNAGLLNYNVNSAAANDVTSTAAGTTDYASLTLNLIDISATAPYTAKLGTGVTETTHAGITAVLDLVNAYLSALNADTAAETALATKKAAVVALDANFGDDATPTTALLSKFFIDGTPTVAEYAAEATAQAVAVNADINGVAWNVDEATTEADFATAIDADVTAGFLTTANATAIKNAFNGALTVVGDLAAAQTAASTAYAAQTTPLEAAKAAYDTAIASVSVVETQATKATAVKTVETAISDLAKAITELNDVKALDTQRTTLEKAVTTATHAIGAAGYDLNNANGQYDSNADGDYIDAGEYDFSAATAAAEKAEKEVYTVAGGDRTVAAFQAGDVIVVSAYTHNTGKIATAGDNSKLEYFVTEVAGSTVITLEQVAYGSNSTAVGSEAEVAITLTGVTMDKLVFGADYITLA